jgi:NAD-reducing hydrogenase large subunit
MAVQIPDAARLLRELLHCAQFVQSHALSFFYLSAPDLLLGFDSDPASRNVLGLAEKHPELARDGIALRKFGQQTIERLAGERIHPSWTTPGGVNAPLKSETRDVILSELPIAKSIVRRTIKFFKAAIEQFHEEIGSFGDLRTHYAGLVDPEGNLNFYDGALKFIDADGQAAGMVTRPRDYAKYVAEAPLAHSYLKAPYYRPLGFPDGIYRVGPLARLNVAAGCGAPEAGAELAEFRQRFGRPAHSSFLYHYARLIEALYGVERMEQLLEDPDIVSSHVRATAGVNAMEGVGIAEAPRGTLIHHYEVDEQGAMKWANLIIATGHNNLAINRAVKEVAQRYVDGAQLKEGALNRVQAVVRAYDPCLSCSTHALGMPSLRVQLVGPAGELLDERVFE